MVNQQAPHVRLNELSHCLSVIDHQVVLPEKESGHVLNHIALNARWHQALKLIDNYDFDIFLTVVFIECADYTASDTAITVNSDSN